jgi:2-polyprenyl-6-methoxyphenol hydroxylase-like FAD-dependent oxidoreductase
VKKTDRILIVGGGIAGLALAVALRQRGFQFDLIERSATWTTAGAGIILHANTTRALHTIGLEKDVIARGAVLPAVKHLDKRGRAIGEVFLGDVWDGLGPTVGIHRWELHDVLLSAISNPSIRMGTSLVGLRQNEGCVQVSLSDGSNHEYALVVGADGIRSTVRQSVFPVTSPSLTDRSVEFSNRV